MLSKKVRGLYCLAVSVGFVTAANAADLDGLVVKAPPELPDLTWNGITVIGAVDIAGQYESKGVPTGGFYTSASLITPWNRGPQWVLAPNQSTQSFVGLKVDESLTADLKVIARLEMGFVPTTGAIADGYKATQANNGIPLNQQTENGGSSRAGQILNGEAWGGFDSKTWGTFHVGRNNTVSVDMASAYDPLFSYGFSQFGYIGYLAGQGSPDTGRIDSSIKYLNTWGPLRTELMYGHPDTNAKDFFQGTIG
jgi:predicted porin